MANKILEMFLMHNVTLNSTLKKMVIRILLLLLKIMIKIIKDDNPEPYS